jgi:hypothetical protein
MAYTTINKSTDYFNALTFTGDGSSSRNITGVGHQPDLVWIKNRESSSQWHFLFDAVRGASKAIHSNVDNSESTQASTQTAFLSDGFTVGSDSASNGNGNGIVSWNWKAGGTGSSNTNGSITSTVSANQTAGFSIVKWTATGSAATIGHGLGSAPKMIILKPLTTSGVWLTWHTALDIKGQVQLNETQAQYVHSGNIYWNGTLPTSTVFSTGTSGSVSSSGTEYIAYCFADVPGYSKFGSYTGNGNSNGPFNYTGFKPAFTLVKRIDSTNDWNIQDTARQIYNGQDGVVLQANEAKSESDIGSGFARDSLSNGFKIRNTGTETNADGGTYIYMAFGQSIVGSNNVPATAR